MPDMGFNASLLNHVGKAGKKNYLAQRFNTGRSDGYKLTTED